MEVGTLIDSEGKIITREDEAIGKTERSMGGK
jgi:hypothetical protein